MSGKPTVATVPPSFTVRLAAMGKGVKRRLLAGVDALSRQRGVVAAGELPSDNFPAPDADVVPFRNASVVNIGSTFTVRLPRLQK